MAIRLTNTLKTSEGSTSTLYFHIVHIAMTEKDGSSVQVGVKYFTNEDKATPCKPTEDVDKILSSYVVDISATIDTLTTKKALYDEIGAFLLAAGFTPESDETGSWVAYS
jgi:hypothetical protein